MIYFNLVFNLALLVALTVVSGFIDRHWFRHTRLVSLLQGVLFGCVAVIAMLWPLELAPGVFFAGRYITVSLCALFFGPWAAAVTCVITAAGRIVLGTGGTVTGVLVVLAAAGIGLWAHFRLKPATQPMSILSLYLFGLAVQVVMIALMFALPGGAGLDRFSHIGVPRLLFYPLITVLVGKILSDQILNIRNIETLKENEERYRLLFDTSIDAILLTAPSGEVFAANPAACRIFGKSEEEIKAAGRDGMVDNSDPRLTAALEERSRTGKFTGELTFVRKDGSRFPGAISSALFHDKDGLLRNSMIIRDITESKMAQDNINKLFSRHQVLLSAIPDIIMEVDINKIYTWANESGLEFFGEDVIGREACFYFEEEQCIYDVVAPIFQGSEEVIYVESWQRRKDGQKRLLAWWCRALKDTEGNVTGALSSARDITEQKSAEEEIKNLNEKLEQRVRERTAELLAKTADLERINHLFVDRELRMKELKAKIAELEGRVS